MPRICTRCCEPLLSTAKPGTTNGGVSNGTWPRFTPDPGSTALPASELALQPILADADGNALASLTFTPPAPGTYPVFVGGNYHDCVDAAGGADSMFIGQFGTVVAH